MIKRNIISFLALRKWKLRDSKWSKFSTLFKRMHLFYFFHHYRNRAKNVIILYIELDIIVILFD